MGEALSRSHPAVSLRLDFPRAFAKLLANKSKNFREASLIHSVQKFIPLAIAFAMQAVSTTPASAEGS